MQAGLELLPVPTSPVLWEFVLKLCFSRLGFSVANGCSGTPSVDQAGLKITASASQVIGLKECATPTPDFLNGSLKLHFC